jgi:hypothetical protein
LLGDGYVLSLGKRGVGMTSTARELIPPELDQLIDHLADQLGHQHRPVVEKALVRAYALGYHSVAEEILRHGAVISSYISGDEHIDHETVIKS